MSTELVLISALGRKFCKLVFGFTWHGPNVKYKIKVVVNISKQTNNRKGPRHS